VINIKEEYREKVDVKRLFDDLSYGRCVPSDGYLIYSKENKEARNENNRTSNQEVISAKEVYVGIDVHKESWHVTIRSDGEELQRPHSGPVPVIEEGTRTVPGRKDQVAYEAGPFGFWLLDRLVQDGIEAIVVPPSLIPTESGNKVKQTRETAASWQHLWKRICSNGYTC